MTQGNKERDAMFEFARCLGDPAFRKILNDHGCRNAQDTVVTLDDTPVVEVLDRVFTRARPPALVAIWRETSGGRGFVFLFVTAAVAASDQKPEKVRPVPVGSTASIGMLYDSIKLDSGVTYEIGSHFRYSVQSVGSELIEA